MPEPGRGCPSRPSESERFLAAATAPSADAVRDRPSLRRTRQVGAGAALLIAVSLGAADACRADVIFEWNDVLLQAVGRGQLLGEIKGPGDASRAMAMVQTAMFEAVNSVDRAYRPYHAYIDGGDGASKVAAAAQAAYVVLADLFPQQRPTFDARLQDSLNGLPDAARDKGVGLGVAAGAAMLGLRSDDGAAAALAKTHVPGSAPGDWQPTPPTFQPAYAPGWGEVKPFAVPDVAPYSFTQPPALNSDAYTAAFNEVKDLGSRDSQTRTADQTAIGLFWAYDRPGMGTPPTLYNKIVQTIAEQQGNSLDENARLFALVNIAMADAGIAAWDAKYNADFWRPVTGIHEGDRDGNPDTTGDQSWTPLGAPGPDPAAGTDDFTPPFPAYTSGHATFGAALFEILSDFYESDEMAFTIASDELPVGSNTRTFTRFSDAAAENGRSRIYLGIHWNFDDIDGQAMGRAIADDVFANVLRPLPEPASLSSLGIALAGIGAFASRRRRGP